MIFAYFILFVALTISAIAEYYSIVGLTAIFSAVFWPIVIMGASLGLGKVTAAVWLKLNWERASWTYKLYLVPAVAFLMVLTSMGIFGFLSKAHSDQSLVSGDSQARVAIYDEKIQTAKENIDANRKALKQMDEAVDQVMGRSTSETGADKAVGIRRAQQRERARLQSEIVAEQKTISQLSEERAPIAAEVRKVEAEVGPIKYIAALVYGDNPDANILEKAVRLVIILIVAVFDPLALVLILAAQQSIRWERESQEDQEIKDWFDSGRQRARELDIEAEANATPEEESVPESKADPIACYKCGTDLVNAPGIGPFCPNKTCDVLDSPFVEPEAEKSIFESHPYLLRPFNHFTDTTPIVHKTEVEPVVEEPVSPVAVAQQDLSPNAPGLDASIERPGDYLTTLPQSDRVREAAPARNRGVMNTHLVADNATDLGNPSNTGFGNKFPVAPIKGDVFLRVDTLPNRLYKYNGSNWIEVDKTHTDVYAYEEEYIKYLIEQIDLGKYEPDMLTDVEREQIQQYLGRNAQ